MEKLETLASVSRLSESVIRVLGQSEGRDEYLPFLESALGDATAATFSQVDSTVADVSDILISHWHPDHVGGLPSVLALLRRLWDQRNGNSAATFKPHDYTSSPATIPSSNTNNRLPSILESLLPGSFTPNPSRKHNALYTADTVLGQGTAVFEDLATYLASLGRMLEFCKTEKAGKLYPGQRARCGGWAGGHCDVCEASVGAGTAAARCASVDDVDAGGDDIFRVSGVIVATAAHGVTLHLRKLEDEGHVERLGGEAEHTSWEYVGK
ncbi:Metallo-beta-lactamase domain-containing protein [Favolaschia claudopus]|uniref:Metallo-beta-lactamase domain-containing protein n=1 Tax=Favolaschia claudopus TaxID=2862362 RepID=A0AAW0EFE7_9AGAR